MTEFDYIIEKINNAEFSFAPFKHIYLEDFLTEEHFSLLINNEEINTSGFVSTERMIDKLSSLGYIPMSFPGCVTSIPDYLNWYNSRLGAMPSHTHNLTEGFGIALRLTKPSSAKIRELVSFLNSELFLSTIKNKFGIDEDVSVETAIQKYLSGYEISPHPDVRKKALTYLLNINPSKDMEDLEIHTYLMEFKESKKYVVNEWNTNTKKDRCWVPWSWAETRFVQSKNNSICMFAPGCDTLHAVKLNYDHCKNQRTNIYGNLWFEDKKHHRPPTTWREI